MTTSNWLDEEHRELRLAITGAMSIAYAAELLPALIEALDAAPVLHLDLSGVDEFDAASLQLVCSAHRTALREGKKLFIHGIDREPLLSTITRAGYIRDDCCHPLNSTPCILVGGKN